MIHILRPRDACVECLQERGIAKEEEVSAMRISMRRWIVEVAAMLVAAWGVTASAQGAVREASSVIHQLRIYEIFEGNKQQFHDRFRDHAMRIMVKYDFKIVAMWEAKGDEGTEFVYLLEWPDEATMKDCWEKFMADEEWAEIKRVSARKYGKLVGEIEDRTLKITDYSPRKLVVR
jgi:NIPSNAP